MSTLQASTSKFREHFSHSLVLALSTCYHSNHGSMRQLMESRGVGINALHLAHPSQSPLTPSHNTSSELVAMPEVILSFLFFHPIKASPHLASCDLASVSCDLQKRVEQEWQVLGSQLLTELRDRLYCSTDYFIDTDYSADPHSFDRKSLEEVGRGPQHFSMHCIMIYSSPSHMNFE